jgi:CTP synthase
MLEEGLDKVALKKLDLPEKTSPDLVKWNEFLHRLKNPKHVVNIGLVGKYVELQDSYKSILEALVHGGTVNESKVNIISIQSDFITASNACEKLKNLDGILVAPGFGSRGIEGKIETVKYARENKIPFLGICLGMQMAVIEYARNVLGFSSANTTEVNESTQYPVITFMEEQKEITEKGGTMRLGGWDCKLKEGSKAFEIYGESLINERHRHRYEFNNEYLEDFEKFGLSASGWNPDTGLIEIVELNNHPFFLGVQFHPEYKSTVAAPHPLFVNFIKAAIKNK